MENSYKFEEIILKNVYKPKNKKEHMCERNKRAPAKLRLFI